MNWAQVIAGLAGLYDREQERGSDFYEGPFPKRISGEMDVGQPILTNNHGKETKYVVKKEGISGELLSILKQITNVNRPLLRKDE